MLTDPAELDHSNGLRNEEAALVEPLVQYDRFDPRDIIEVSGSRNHRLSDYKSCLQTAQGGVFISGTSMIHLSEDSADLIQQKAIEGNIRLLLMDPAWASSHHELLTFLDGVATQQRFHVEIELSMDRLRAIHTRLPDDKKKNFQLRCYSTVFPYIITGYRSATKGEMVVEITDYLAEESRPRLTLHSIQSQDGLYDLVLAKFDSLWLSPNLTRVIL